MSRVDDSFDSWKFSRTELWELRGKLCRLAEARAQEQAESDASVGLRATVFGPRVHAVRTPGGYYFFAENNWTVLLRYVIRRWYHYACWDER